MTHLVSTRHLTSHMSNLHVSPEDSHRPVSKETAVTQILNKIFCSELHVSFLCFGTVKCRVLALARQPCDIGARYVCCSQDTNVDLSAASCPFIRICVETCVRK